MSSFSTWFNFTYKYKVAPAMAEVSMICSETLQQFLKANPEIIEATESVNFVGENLKLTPLSQPLLNLISVEESISKIQRC